MEKEKALELAIEFAKEAIRSSQSAATAPCKNAADCLADYIETLTKHFIAM